MVYPMIDRETQRADARVHKGRPRPRIRVPNPDKVVVNPCEACGERPARLFQGGAHKCGKCVRVALQLKPLKKR